MNRRQLEKMFDEEFDLWTTLVQNNFWEHRVNNNNEVKDFIFDTIIPEVLKSVITKELVFDEKEENDDWFYWLWHNHNLKMIKQKAKEQFNINL